MAATVIVGATYPLGRSLGLRPGYTLAAALPLAFASSLWVYTKGLANIPLAALLAVLTLLPISTGLPGARSLAISGALPGLTVVARPKLITFVMSVGVLSLPNWRAAWWADST